VVWCCLLGTNLFTSTGGGRGEDKVYDVEVSCVPGSKKTAARDVASSPASCRLHRREEDEDVVLRFRKKISEAVGWIGYWWAGVGLA
jgi:hypothetical protein